MEYGLGGGSRSRIGGGRASELKAFGGRDWKSGIFFRKKLRCLCFFFLKLWVRLVCFLFISVLGWR